MIYNGNLQRSQILDFPIERVLQKHKFCRLSKTVSEIALLQRNERAQFLVEKVRREIGEHVGLELELTSSRFAAVGH